MVSNIFKGQSVWIVEHNRYISEVKVLDRNWGFVLVEFPYGARIQLRATKCFATREEAQRSIRRYEDENLRGSAVHSRTLYDATALTGNRYPRLH